MSRIYRQSAIKKNLALRARMIQAVRRFFEDHDYLEIETPHRIPAPAPEQHIDAEPSGDWFLHTSPELCMKRLLAAGYHRIFQICKCFRSRERGGRHLPEMTMLEWYTAGADYDQLMDQTEALIQFVSRRLGLKGPLRHQGRAVDLTRPWSRMTVSEAFDRFATVALSEALKSDRFDAAMGLEIEPNLGLDQPVFLYDYPHQCGALARLKPDQPEIAERFELYIGGLELCNGFSELTDPDEQQARFQSEMALRRRDGKSVYPIPERFLEALSDMPASAGNALGIDRLAMLLADAADIDEIVAFCPEEL